MQGRSPWPWVIVAIVGAVAAVAIALIVTHTSGGGSTAVQAAHVTPATASSSTTTSSSSGTATAKSSKPKVIHETTTIEQTPAASPPAAPSSSGSGLTNCDQNIQVNGNTSCPFADNVFSAYAADVQASGSGSYTVTADSTVTGSTYTDDCILNATDQTVDCSHGSDLVQFPEWAAEVYTG